MAGVAGERFLEQGGGHVRLARVKCDLAKLIVGLGLHGLQLDGTLELRLGLIEVLLLHLKQVAEAKVRGRIFGAHGEVGTQVTLGGWELLAIELHAGEGVEGLRIAGSEPQRGFKRVLRDGQLMDLLGLDAEIQQQHRIIGKMFSCVLEAEKGSIRSACSAALDRELRGGAELTLPGFLVTEADAENGLKAIHGFGVAMLIEEDLSAEVVRGWGVGTGFKRPGKEMLGVCSAVLVKADLREG